MGGVSGSGGGGAAGSAGMGGGGAGGSAGASGTSGGAAASGTSGGAGAAGTAGGAGASGTSGGAGSGGSSGGSAGSSAGASGSGGVGGMSGNCGNGTVDPGEECDGSNLQNSTCASLGFSSGTLSCSSTCQFNVVSCVGGTITPTVTTSRSTCAAPCAVYFNATTTSGLSGSDFVGANWTWDFRDTASVHKGTIGFLAAHVFDNPGTYIVVTRVRDLVGAAGTTSTTITVSAMSGTTYYVSAAGSDSNAGTSIGTAFLTLQHALTLAGTNKSILLRRGDTFTFSSIFTISGVTGPFLIGAFVDPGHVSAAAPIISSSASQVSNILSPDIRFTDLHIIQTNQGSGIGFTNATHALIERVEIEGVGSPSISGLLTFGIDGSDNPIFFFDDHAHNFIGYGLYGDRTNNVAIAGTTFDVFSGGEHGVRLQGGNTNPGDTGFSTNAYVAENVFTPSISGGAYQTQDSMTFRGDNKQIVFVNNTTADGAHFQPQNTGVIEHISDVLDEGNQFIDTLATDASYVAENIAAQHVYIRNNIYVNCGLPIAIQGYPLLPANWTDKIFIYNNTVYTIPIDSNQYFAFEHFGTTGALTMQNNIFYQTSSNTNSSLFYTSGSGTETFDHNLVYSPNATLSTPHQGTGGLLTNPLFVTNGSNFHLQSGSPAKDSGTNTHVYESFGLAPGRPQNSTWDDGAYEFKNP